jgi:hypothetical protein
MSWLRRSSLLVLVLLLGAGVGCSNDALGPSSDQSQSRPSFGLIGDLTDGLINTVGGVTDQITGTLTSVTDVLLCSSQPYMQVTETIGPKGGVIRIGDHTLAIPRGALRSDVTITAEQVSGSTNSLRFSPEGLQFEQPAVLTMTYDNCAVVLIQKKIVYTDENLKIREVLRSLDLFRKKMVSAPIDHFSRYAVAW